MTALITREGLAVLDDALAWIDKHPEQHYQGSWARRGSCGTTYCLAGTVAVLAGAEPVWRKSSYTLRGDEDACVVRLPSGVTRAVDVYAAELLGLDPAGVGIDMLFYAGTRAHLAEARDKMAASLDGVA